MTAQPGFIAADWPAPSHIFAGTTTRQGGVSTGAYSSLNLGDRAGDDPAAVSANRSRLATYLDLPAEPAWLWQVHGTDVADAARPGQVAEADASFTRQAAVICAVLTADCLPVLLSDQDGQTVAAAHCGWRGLAAGVLGTTVSAMGKPPEQLLAWLGPAIGPQAFEVGSDVRDAFVARDAAHAHCFQSIAASGKHLADLYALAAAELRALGVSRIYGGGHCTVSEPELFYSYRRDKQCGRMASLIWRRS